MFFTLPRLCTLLLALLTFTSDSFAQIVLQKGDRISIIGNTLADRMQHDGWLETLIQSRHTGKELVFRDLGFSADEINRRPRSESFGTPDEWLAKTKTDVIFAFFGYNESLAGEGGLNGFKQNLAGFIDQTLKQNYSGKGAPRLVLFSPIAHENLKLHTLPDGSENNARLALYTKAMAEVAKAKGVLFVDLFEPSKDLYTKAAAPLTINGIHLNSDGNEAIAKVIDAALFGAPASADTSGLKKLREAVLDKNFHWFSRYRVIDEYNVFGGRSKLSWHGQSNADVMMREMEILDVMTANRDRRIWAVAAGGDLKIDDSNTPPEVVVKTNYPGPLPGGKHPFLGGEEAIKKMKIAKGMQVNLFASEEQFPQLIKPVQMSVDTNGRLWVATWPSYPHWNPKKPLADKIVILPDDDGDGKADRMITFADNLNSVTGFEFWGGGVLVAAAPEIWFLKDTDGDDKADVKIRMLQGVSSADSHHTANALVIGPDGGLYFSHGVFHVDNSETPTKTFRHTGTGVYRFDPRTFEVDFHFPIGPNPHGNVFDQWGYQFATDGTGGTGNYIAIGKGVGAPKNWYQMRVRPVPAIGILSSSHFPPENNGNFLICNAIGFLGVLQHEVKYNGADINAVEVEPIVVSSDPNFRPTDLEVGGDGALYISDWCNPIIGHMQHNMRDPNRDDVHGRIYRVTAIGRPLLKPVKLKDKPIAEVLAAFYAKENGTRYRARLELSGRKTSDVTAAISQWASAIEPSSAEHEQALLEGLWVFEEHRVANEELLKKVLLAKEPRVRAAAIRTLGHWGAKVSGWEPMLIAAARDSEALVRAEAVKAAPSFDGLGAADAIFEAALRPTDIQLDFDLNWARGKINVDKMVSDALTAKKALSPAAMAYALQKSSIASLLTMERTEAVCLAMLSRTGVKPADRLTALDDLGKLRKTTAVAELFAALANPDSRFSASLSDLASLLPSLSAEQLKPHSEQIAALAVSKASMDHRAAGFAAMIKVDGSAKRASDFAGQSMGNMQAFLGSLGRITDAATLDSVYSSVKQLTHTLPAGLVKPDAKPGTVGQFVRIELPRNGTLTLAEVEVFSLGGNVAKGKPAKQSSIANSAGAERAVDGRTDGVFNNGSATHTNENEKNPWWEVDLGADQPIDAINVWNRTDCCAERLNGFTVTVLSSAREPVYTKANNTPTKQDLGFKLEGDPAASIHIAAINTLVTIPGHDAESFDELVALITANKHRATATNAILKVKPAWTPEKAAGIAKALRQSVPSIPLNQRTGQLYKDSQVLAKQVAAQLPKVEGDSLLAELSNFDLQVVRIGTILERMMYDKTSFAVVAGKPVRVTLENLDKMPHNLLIVTPGGSEIVGPLAEAMGADGFKKNFQPDHKAVLHAMGLVNPDKTGTLDFIAPTTPGDYEYVCTFPGHWRLMRGVMKVVATAAELPHDSAGASKQVVHDWKLKDLEPDLAHISHGRSFDAGKAAFNKLGCGQCHKLGGAGGAAGPDLADILKKWKGNRGDLLQQILEPSKVIEDKFKSIDIETKDGDRLFGLVASRAADHVMLVTNPQNPVPQRIEKKDIESERVSPLSIMPAGLLNLLERADILDLMAYIEANGDAKHAVYGKH